MLRQSTASYSSAGPSSVATKSSAANRTGSGSGAGAVAPVPLALGGAYVAKRKSEPITVAASCCMVIAAGVRLLAAAPHARAHDAESDGRLHARADL